MQTASWGLQQSWFTRDLGNFGDNVTLIIKLVVPPGTHQSTDFGRFSGAEYLGPNTFRQMTISKTPGDFRPKDYTGSNGPFQVANGTTAQVSYGVMTPSPFVQTAGLTAGETYYINMRNWQLDPTPQPSCGQSSCGAVVNHIPAKP